MTDLANPKRSILARYEAGWPNDWNGSPPVSGPADAEIYQAGARLRDWARYLAKNSALVKAVLDSRVAKGIGTGLRYEPMVKDRQGNPLEKLNAAIRKMHDDWSLAADVTGELSRQEIERVVWRDWDTAGEVFGRKVWRGRTAQRIGYQIQLIRSELVPYGWVGGGRAMLGIERDDWGKPVQYWVYPRMPGLDLFSFSFQAGIAPKSIPSDEIVHLRRQEETDATRGVTLFHAVILRVSDISEFQQSHRRAARASANLFASINRSMEYQAPEPDIDSWDAHKQTDLDLGELQIIDYLRQGESVNFHTPSHPNQNAIEFVNQELRQFASACRVAFSWIAYVFDRAYAAQRTELVHAWEMIIEDRAHFIRDFALPMLYREPLRIAILEGRLPARELRRADPDTLYDVRIDGPVMPSIDPLADRKTAQLDQEMGWESRQGNIRRLGRNPEQVDHERMSDQMAPVIRQKGPSVEPDEPTMPEEDAADAAL